MVITLTEGKMLVDENVIHLIFIHLIKNIINLKIGMLIQFRISSVQIYIPTFELNY